MNSSILHRYERWFYRFLFPFILFAVASVVAYVVDNQSLAYTVLSTIAKVLLVASIFINYMIIVKTKEWRKNGRELTEKIGLKRILLLESNLLSRSQTTVYEIHHTPAPFKYGFVLRKKKRSDIIAQLKKELEEDFKKLHQWKNEQERNCLFITTTHPSMIHLWKKASSDNFYVKKMDQILDPYVKMNIWQWALASFSTTGRLSFKPPTQWDSYYFFSVTEK